MGKELLDMYNRASLIASRSDATLSTLTQMVATGQRQFSDTKVRTSTSKQTANGPPELAGAVEDERANKPAHYESTCLGNGGAVRIAKKKKAGVP